MCENHSVLTNIRFLVNQIFSTAHYDIFIIFSKVCFRLSLLLSLTKKMTDVLKKVNNFIV